MIVRITIVLICLVLVNSIHKIPGFPSSQVNQAYQANLINNGDLPYQVLFYPQKVSHYNYKYSGQTYNQKYLINIDNWSKANKGPIVMYCGNQGPIEMFYKNSGWYNDFLVKQLKGLLVYPEHRYFGKSWPFGDQKTSMLKENLVLLTTEEAMMDFVQFIQFIKKTYCSDCPVIVFGGSFGGMLATWMRMKYPNVVDIAHAASAPIYYYRNRKNFDFGIFSKITTKNYRLHNENCPNVIREGFKRLIKYSSDSKAPISEFSKWFNLCTPLKVYSDVQYIMNYMEVAYQYMAMINYPYPTSFLKNVTGWPANSSCIPLDSVNPKSTDEQLFTAIRKSVQYYYSFGKSQCNQVYDDNSSDDDMSGWNVLACGDQAMPMNMDGQTDMFYEAPFDYDGYNQFCSQTFGIKPDYDFTLNHFGGITDRQYLSASRIVFTNGGLDPWSGASPITDLSPNLVSCYIPNGAHHLDLRPPNDADPEDVRVCRSYVKSKLIEWLRQVRAQRYGQSQQNNITTE